MLEIYREYIYNIKGRIITNFNLDDFKQFYAEISMSINGFKTTKTSKN